MENGRNYELQLMLASSYRMRGYWGAKLETAVTATVRYGASLPDRYPSRDTLLMAASTSALSRVSKQTYTALQQRANDAGSERPRLLIHAFSGFIDAIEGRDRLRAPDHLKRAFDATLGRYEVSYVPNELNPNAELALLKWVQKSLLLSDDQPKPKPKPFDFRPQPQLIAETMAPPLTPHYGTMYEHFKRTTN